MRWPSRPPAHAKGCPPRARSGERTLAQPATLLGLGLIPSSGPAEPTKLIASALDVLLGGLEPRAA
jgi:hypothetical protein